MNNNQNNTIIANLEILLLQGIGIAEEILSSTDQQHMDKLLNNYNNNFLQIQDVLDSLTNNSNNSNNNNQIRAKIRTMVQQYTNSHDKVLTHVEKLHGELVDNLNSTRKRKQAYKGYSNIFIDRDKSFLDNEG